MMDEELVRNGLKTILKGLGDEPEPLRPTSLPGQPVKLLNAQQILRITLIISAGLGAVLFVASFMNIASQNRVLFNQQTDKAREFANTVVTAIRYPMMTGDQEVIQMQFDEFSKLPGLLEMELIDHKMMIKRSTYKGEIKKNFNEVKASQEKTGNVDRALSRQMDFSGLEARKRAPDGSSSSVMTVIRPISNDRMCASCHGANLKTLGALRIELDWTQTEKEMRAGQQRNITFALIGALIMAGLVFGVLSNFAGKK
jgi:hypothetical protein